MRNEGGAAGAGKNVRVVKFQVDHTDTVAGPVAEFLLGTTIKEAAHFARAYALANGLPWVRFTFNGVPLTVGPADTAEEAVRLYWLPMTGGAEPDFNGPGGG